MLHISKIDDCFKILTDEEVKDFEVLANIFNLLKRTKSS